jgi:hypothetical protein
MTPTLFPFSPDTNHPVLVILADCSIGTARRQHLRFHMATTSRSGPFGSTLTRHRHCSSPPWFAQPLAIKCQSSQYLSFSCTRGTVSGQLCLLLLLDLIFRQVGYSSLQDEVCLAWQGQQERGGGVGLQEWQLFPLSLSSLKSLSLSVKNQSIPA